MISDEIRADIFTAVGKDSDETRSCLVLHSAGVAGVAIRFVRRRCAVRAALRSAGASGRNRHRRHRAEVRLDLPAVISQRQCRPAITSSLLPARSSRRKEMAMSGIPAGSVIPFRSIFLTAARAACRSAQGFSLAGANGGQQGSNSGPFSTRATFHHRPGDQAHFAGRYPYEIRGRHAGAGNEHRRRAAGFIDFGRDAFAYVTVRAEWHIQLRQ